MSIGTTWKGGRRRNGPAHQRTPAPHSKKYPGAPAVHDVGEPRGLFPIRRSIPVTDGSRWEAGEEGE